MTITLSTICQASKSVPLTLLRNHIIKKIDRTSNDKRRRFPKHDMCFVRVCVGVFLRLFLLTIIDIRDTAYNLCVIHQVVI